MIIYDNDIMSSFIRSGILLYITDMTNKQK